MKSAVVDYLQLTKPRIVLLFGITGLAAIVVEGSLLHQPTLLSWLLVGIIGTAASANALNQYFDRDIDAVMERTRLKRPLPSGRMEPWKAMVFGVVVGMLSCGILLVGFNPLTAALGAFTVLFYIYIYTLWLKRSTPYNIVIGGAAGATAPLMGWAAAAGSISLSAWLMFLLIFLWTPAHFWALSLCIKDEYAAVAVPMLPVVRGEEVTRKQVLLYTVLTVPIPFLIGLTESFSALYWVAVSVLGLEFVRRALGLVRRRDVKTAWGVFGYSILYLFAVFIVMCAAVKR